MQLSENARIYQLKQAAKRWVALCYRCDHPIREHQPAYGSGPGDRHPTVGCSICACQLTLNEKLRGWGGAWGRKP